MEFGTIYIQSPVYLPSMPTHIEVDGFTQRIEQDLHARHYADTVITARLFNIGNIGREATVRLVKRDGTATHDDVLRVAREVMRVDSLRSGNILLTLTDDLYPSPDITSWTERTSRPIPSAAPTVNASIRPSASSRNRRRKIQDEERVCAEPCLVEAIDLKEEIIGLNESDALEEIEIIGLSEPDPLEEAEEAKRRDFELLRAAVLKYITEHRADPEELMRTLLRGKYILRDDGMSRLTINRDLKIILPDYDELEIRLAPLAKALYILFLKYPKGIVLKDIGDYRDELSGIYELVMPGRDDTLAEQAIDNVCSPFSDTLRQNLSRIKRAFSVNILDKTIAEQYYIHGRRGEPYRIDLKPDLVTLPAVFA